MERETDRGGEVLRGDKTKAKVLKRAKSGNFKSMACIAEDIGCTRENVRLILNAVGENRYTNKKRRLEWDCPRCGEHINRTLSRDRKIHRMPAHCRDCATLYCMRGLHLLSETRNNNGSCQLCINAYYREIVETRPCSICEEDWLISRGTASQMKYGYIAGLGHVACTGKKTLNDYRRDKYGT